MEFNVYLRALGIGFIWRYMFSTTKCPRCKHRSARNSGVPTGFYIAKETLFIDLPPCENYGNCEENGSPTVGTAWHLHVCSLFSTCDRYELDCCTNVLSIGRTGKCSFFHGKVCLMLGLFWLGTGTGNVIPGKGSWKPSHSSLPGLPNSWKTKMINWILLLVFPHPNGQVSS